MVNAGPTNIATNMRATSLDKRQHGPRQAHDIDTDVYIVAVLDTATQSSPAGTTPSFPRSEAEAGTQRQTPA